MTIHPKSATETPAQIATQAFTPVRQNQSTQTSTNISTPTDAWSGLTVSDTESGGELDGASADQLMQALAKSMFDNSAQALSAQSGLNSQSALELIQ